MSQMQASIENGPPGVKAYFEPKAPFLKVRRGWTRQSILKWVSLEMQGFMMVYVSLLNHSEAM